MIFILFSLKHLLKSSEYRLTKYRRENNGQNPWKIFAFFSLLNNGATVFPQIILCILTKMHALYLYKTDKHKYTQMKAVPYFS